MSAIDVYFLKKQSLGDMGAMSGLSSLGTCWDRLVICATCTEILSKSGLCIPQGSGINFCTALMLETTRRWLQVVAGCALC